MWAARKKRSGFWEGTMNNPYKVLGVREDATQEEIRAAYLSLVKKYHPDKYSDSDLKELANEKLVEINAAYEFLTKKSSSRSASSTYSEGRAGGQSYSGSGGSYSGPNAPDFARARLFINQNNIQAARAVLDGIPVRNAEWYYLYGVVYLRQGWYDKAHDFFGRAVQQEPGNSEYNAAYQSVRSSGSPYARGGYSGGYTRGVSGCDVCTGLLCADCCCESCGGDLIPCC
jgi:molecular chaperone DnaJ